MVRTYAIATNPPPMPIMVPISRMSLQIDAIAAFCTLIMAPWKNPKKTQNTYNPGIVIPNHVKIVTLFMRAKGTRTLNLRVRTFEVSGRNYGPNRSATNPGRIRPNADDPFTMERR
jgi:hypothetical protein